MTPLNAGTRIGSMIVDHFCMTMIVTILCAPGMIYDIFQTLNNPEAPPKLILGNYYVNIFAFSLYFCKDIVQGRSIAKRIFKLQLVNARTGQPAGSIRCLVRNITTILWPIEVAVALVNNERRIGDFIAGTKLVPYDPNAHQTKIRWEFVGLAVLIAIMFTYLLLFYPIEVISRNAGFTG
jgi:uncharacterized RDD family membrane protein YckC